MTPVEIVIAALQEDAPAGDLTTNSLIVDLGVGQEKTIGYFIAKQNLILSGIQFLKIVAELNLDIDVETFYDDGTFVKTGQKIAQFYGPWNKLVLVERTVLNILGRLSGIATLTNSYVKSVKHTKCRILDTRKTTPLYRMYEKKAVIHGGGINHRLDLSTEIMLKENHICRIKGSLALGLTQLREKHPRTKITVECQNLDQVKYVSNAPIDQILLDNMNIENTKEALKLISNNIKTEASGNMNLQRVGSVAETGVDFISVGALTHSVNCSDVSFLLEP